MERGIGKLQAVDRSGRGEEEGNFGDGEEEFFAGGRLRWCEGDRNSRREREGNRGEEEAHGSFPERETMEESRRRAGRGRFVGEVEHEGKLEGSWRRMSSWRKKRRMANQRGDRQRREGILAVERGGGDGGWMRSWRRGWRHGRLEAAAAAA